MRQLAIKLKSHIESHEPAASGIYRMILAQSAHESNYGESALAREFNNFCGMKARKELEVLPGYRAVDYRDWLERQQDTPKKKRDADSSFDSIESFCFGYFIFIRRAVYKKFGKTPMDYFDDPQGYIIHLARCGWCGHTPGIKRSQFPKGSAGSKLYKQARNRAYVERIMHIFEKSKRLDQIIDGSAPSVSGDADQMPEYLRLEE